MIPTARPGVKRSIQPGVSESVSASKEESGSNAGGGTRLGITGGTGTGGGIRFSAAVGVSIFAASGWSNGDFNYDGVVDGSDYSLIDNAFNQVAAIAGNAVITAASPADVISAAKPKTFAAAIPSASASSNLFNNNPIAPNNIDDLLDDWNQQSAASNSFAG